MLILQGELQNYSTDIYCIYACVYFGMSFDGFVDGC